MDDADFIREIVKNKADDGPRYVYADWLDSQGRSERAEFIRVQIEIARCGPPHIVVTEPCVLSGKYGPDYYTLTGGEDTEGSKFIMEAEVGRRVDILKPRGKKGPMFGLRIHKIDERDKDEIIVVRDAQSKPWDGHGLRLREKELLYPSVGEYFGHRGGDGVNEKWWDMVMTGGMQYGFGTSRGFVGRVTLTWDSFQRHAARMFRDNPIEKVEITSGVNQPFCLPYPDSQYVWEVGGAPGMERARMTVDRRYDGMLPIEITKHLGVGRKVSSSIVDPLWRYYGDGSSNAAMQELSDACVRFGEHAAWGDFNAAK